MPLVRKSEDINIDYILKQSSNKLYDEYIPKNIPSRMYEVIKVSKDHSTIKLIDKYQFDLLSIINGTLTVYHDKEYFEISGTYSKNERSGNLTYLFEFIVYELGYNILSDGEHSTPGSKEFWQAQIRRKNFDIYRFNIKTNYKRKANSFEENEIWKEYLKKSELYLDDLQDLEEIEILNEDNFEDLPKLEFEVEELDSKTINELEKEFGIVKETKKINMKDIRLIAQKYTN